MPAETPAAAIGDLHAALGAEGRRFGHGPLRRVFRRRGITRKDPRTRRDRILPTSRSAGTSFGARIDRDPDRLACIDGEPSRRHRSEPDGERDRDHMGRTHGRAPRGRCLRPGFPRGHRKTATFVGAPTSRGMIAPLVAGGPIHRDAFGTSVERVPAPGLRPGDVGPRGARPGGAHAPHPGHPLKPQGAAPEP